MQVGEQFSAKGNQNPLVTGASPNFVPVANVQNRFANLRATGVWDAIIAKAFGTPVEGHRESPRPGRWWGRLPGERRGAWGRQSDWNHLAGLRRPVTQPWRPGTQEC